MILFLIVGTLGVLSNLLLIFTASVDLVEIFGNRNFGVFTPFVSMLLTAILLFGVFHVQQALYCSIKNNFFNPKSANHLKNGSFLLAISGFLGIANDFINVNFASKESLLFSSIVNCLILIVGVAIMAVSDILNKAEIIEQENMLTI